MDALTERKKKWFIDTADPRPFPPQVRHPGSLVSDHTDGSLVTPLIDGAAMMSYFNDRLKQLGDVAEQHQAEIWLAAMGREPVRLLGVDSPSKDAMTAVLDTVKDGVHVSFLCNGQGGMAFESRKYARQLIEQGRLHLYPTTRFRVEFPWGLLMNKLIDPYAGPDRG